MSKNDRHKGRKWEKKRIKWEKKRRKIIKREEEEREKKVTMDLFIASRNKNHGARWVARGFATRSNAVMSTALVSAREPLVLFHCLLPFSLLFELRLSTCERCNQLWRLYNSLLVVRVVCHFIRFSVISSDFFFLLRTSGKFKFRAYGVTTGYSIIIIETIKTSSDFISSSIVNWNLYNIVVLIYNLNYYI